MASKKKLGKLILEEFTKEILLQVKRQLPEVFPEHPTIQKVWERPIAEGIRRPVVSRHIRPVEMHPSIFPRYPPTPSPESGSAPEPEEPKLRGIIKPRAIEVEAETPHLTPLTRPMALPQPTLMNQQFPIPETIASITPSPYPPPPEFSIGKLNQLIRDRRVIAIECPGPEKIILVKTPGKIMHTRISLDKDEIKNTIEAFSQYSRVPIIEGIFKAAVGNLVITAVLSDIVGTRFIINKYTPYSVLERRF